MGFPQTRMRRLRNSPVMRRLLAGTQLHVDSFVYPMFVCPGEGIQTPIASMEGCFHYSADRIADPAQEIHSLGISAILLFGLPEKKDAQEVSPGQSSLRSVGLSARSKAKFPACWLSPMYAFALYRSWPLRRRRRQKNRQRPYSAESGSDGPWPMPEPARTSWLLLI